MLKPENKFGLTDWFFMSKNAKGIYLSLLTAVISGISIFINKYAVDAIKPALYFISIKNCAVALLIITLILMTGEVKKLAKLTGKEVLSLIFIGIIGGSLPFYLYFYGLSQTSAINAAIIHKTLVFWVALMAVPFLKEKITKGQVLAVLILFSGNMLVGGFQGLKFSRGELMIFAATILWAVECILAKKLLFSVSPNIVIAFRMGLGSLILLAATFASVPQALEKSVNLNGVQIFWIILTVFSLLAYVITWYRALKLAPAITVSSVLVSSTLITNVLSAIFITHSWNVMLTVQSVLMISGLILFFRISLKSMAPSLTLN